MRHIPEEMAARIESGAAMLCHAWVLTRADGVQLGFTDHDRDLTLDGVVCAAASGWNAGARDTATGVGPGQAAASGGLDDQRLCDADIDAGLYDRAVLETWRVDWSKPELRVRIWRGTIARLVRTGEAFTAELDGPMAVLERVVGRTYGRECDAVLGDARCGVNLASYPGERCDKRWETCTGRFGNGLNFRGFPDVPGDDFLTAMPTEAQRNDGGSRR
jgi:hypothetical protein